MCVDPHHPWRMLAPIAVPLQICGCVVTPQQISLCDVGAQLKEHADSWYASYREAQQSRDEAVYYEHFRWAKCQYLEHIGASHVCHRCLCISMASHEVLDVFNG